MPTAPPATTGSSSPHAQTLRALVLATVASGGATLAHAAGGGHLVSVTGVVVATALLTGASLPFVRGHLSVARSVALLAALQVAAHVVHGLAALASGSAVHGAGAPAHEAHGIRPLGRIATPAGGSHVGASGGLTDLLPSPTMLLAHVVAAVAVGVLLTRGERSWLVARALLAPLTARAARLADALVCRVAALRCPLGAAPAAALDTDLVGSGGLVPVDVWHARTPVRRGPPALLA